MLIFILTLVTSLLALVGFLGRGLIDYVIARRANRRAAAQRVGSEASWPAWAADPPPAMPYMHAPHLADDFEPTPARPVQDQHGDWPRIARQSAMRGA